MLETTTLVLSVLVVLLAIVAIRLSLRTENLPERSYWDYTDDKEFIVYYRIPLRSKDKELVLRVLEYIQEKERTSRIELSPAARQMLIIPIIEYFSDESGMRTLVRKQLSSEREEEYAMIRESIDQIVMVMFESPSRADTIRDDRLSQVRSSASVIKGFSQRFCRIPPFCTGEDEI